MMGIEELICKKTCDLLNIEKISKLIPKMQNKNLEQRRNKLNSFLCLKLYKVIDLHISSDRFIMNKNEKNN